MESSLEVSGIFHEGIHFGVGNHERHTGIRSVKGRRQSRKSTFISDRVTQSYLMSLVVGVYNHRILWSPNERRVGISTGDE